MNRLEGARLTFSAERSHQDVAHGMVVAGEFDPVHAVQLGQQEGAPQRYGVKDADVYGTCRGVGHQTAELIANRLSRQTLAKAFGLQTLSCCHPGLPTRHPAQPRHGVGQRQDSSTL